MAKKKQPDFEERWLDPEMARPRFEKRHLKTELGWAILKAEETQDNDTGEVCSKHQTLDLLPGSGVVIDSLYEQAALMNVDQVVERLNHCDELALQIRIRKQNLADRLRELVAGADRVIGLNFYAGWDNKKVLAYGPLDEDDREQQRLREEAGQ